MVVLRLPDNSTREAAPGTTAKQIAESIGKRLAQAAIAAKVDGEIVDLNRELPADGEHSFQILTEKDPDALDVLRHSCAHIMARAVMRLFPGAQLAFGPAGDFGYYYDIESPTPIREDDFAKIEAEMKQIVDKAETFDRFELATTEARTLCADLKQALKVEHIDEELKKHPSLSFYRQGEFVDLCRGPHIPHAGKIGAFKILSIAGAYWKNDSTRPQLQRLYGIAFFSQKDLEAYLHRIEEAKRRDHRLLGKQLKLFTISQMVGSGLILWMPKGATVRGILETFIKDELVKRGYSPVYTPHIGRLELYRTSGHFPYYRDAQFPPMYHRPAAGTLDLCQYRLAMGEIDDKREHEYIEYMKQAHMLPPEYINAPSQAAKLDMIHEFVLRLLKELQVVLPEYHRATNHKERADALLKWLMDQEGFLLKPMNCPHHIHIYKAEPHSYRELPIRLAEFGTVYRYEQTGELNGMTRVRGFTQDDAHLFIRPDQVESEFRANIEFVLFIFRTLGLNDYRVRLGFRDPASTKYVGSAEDWDTAQTALEGIVKSLGMSYSAEPGEAAFYGPKIDFVVKDCIGRDWQLGTVQLDYNLPKRFDLEFVGADNKPHRPIMIHRAPFGSMERFMGILIEHFAGAFPLWLAPEQVRVLTVSDKFREYGEKVEAQLRERDVRVTGDFRPDKIGAKIREAQLDKIPYMLVVGDKEQTTGTVAVRSRSAGDRGVLPIAEFMEELETEVKCKSLTPTV
ncbi:MAG: threonine--tRNA ligase [Gemmataceae bacterium]|nr:threonine--tRNA ligase [Gemmataceae bacterium]